ncbi:hypothetical protein B0H11DRAFT_2245263 [Mycena galericulata]|nr:hypothetical protein B0H11DRAFT_2245263 [Mycena galericulata]
MDCVSTGDQSANRRSPAPTASPASPNPRRLDYGCFLARSRPASRADGAQAAPYQPGEDAMVHVSSYASAPSSLPSGIAPGLPSVDRTAPGTTTTTSSGTSGASVFFLRARVDCITTGDCLANTMTRELQRRLRLRRRLGFREDSVGGETTLRFPSLARSRPAAQVGARSAGRMRAVPSTYPSPPTWRRDFSPRARDDLIADVVRVEGLASSLAPAWLRLFRFLFLSFRGRASGVAAYSQRCSRAPDCSMLCAAYV